MKVEFLDLEDIEKINLEDIEKINKVEFTLPAWNVVKGSAFRYFIPEDEIDRGLMLSRVKKREEVQDGGK